MADNKTQAGSPDRERVSLGEDYEMRDRKQSLGVSEVERRETVDVVGNSAAAARAYLKTS